MELERKVADARTLAMDEKPKPGTRSVMDAQESAFIQDVFRMQWQIPNQNNKSCPVPAIIRVERIHNPSLEKKFETKRRKSKRVASYAFHGTPIENLDSICKLGICKSLYGRCYYLSKSALYSLSYSRCQYDGVKHLICARILLPANHDDYICSVHDSNHILPEYVIYFK